MPGPLHHTFRLFVYQFFIGDKLNQSHIYCCFFTLVCGWPRPKLQEFVLYISCTRPPLWSSGHTSWLENGDILCFLWGANWIYICYVEESRLPLWSSGQSSWIQNGDVLCFLWGTNWIYICYVQESKKKKSLVKCPIFGLDTKTYWLTDRQSQCDFDFDFDFD
jgi:hypothetical protein